MVDSTELQKYIDKKYSELLIAGNYGQYPYNRITNYNYRYYLITKSTNRTVGTCFNKLREEYTKNKRSNAQEYIPRKDRRAFVEKQKHKLELLMGRKIIEKFLMRDCYLKGFISIDEINTIVKKEFLVNDNVKHNQELLDAMVPRVAKMFDEFEKIETAVLCGAITNPIKAFREFEETEW